MRVYDNALLPLVAAEFVENPGYRALADPALELAEFGPMLADMGDSPGGGLWLLETCSAAFSEATDVKVAGDLTLPRGQPLLVVGDLYVSGHLSTTTQLLVTGSVYANTVSDSGPDSYVTILGDLHTRGLWTTGTFYVGGDIVAESLVWAGMADEWLAAARVQTRVFIECPDHPWDCGIIDAELQACVSNAADYPWTFLVADVFALALYMEDGHPDKRGIFEWLAEGKDIFAVDGQGPSPLPLADFEAWLRDYEGSQRTKLETLRSRWLSRLSAFEPEAVKRMLGGYFKSPKRRADLESLLEELEELRSA